MTARLWWVKAMEQRDPRRAPAMSATRLGSYDGVLSELCHLYGASKHLHTTLTLMAAGPHTPAVAHLIATARRESSTQLWRIERLFAHLDEEVGRRRCFGMARILEGRDTATGPHPSEAAIYATVAQAAQYLAALYATAAAHARALGYEVVAAELDHCMSGTNALALRASHVGQPTSSDRTYRSLELRRLLYQATGTG